MDKRITGIEKLYYKTYLLMRITCWFLFGILFACVVQNVKADIVFSASDYISIGAIFSLLGGFFLGLYRMLTEA